MAEPEDLFDPRMLQGDGKTEVALFAHTQRVIVRFRTPQLWFAMGPPQALEFAKKMIDCAAECGMKIEIKVPRREIPPHKREALVTRALHVMRSMTEQHRPPKDIARHVVDSIISAID